MIGFCLLDPVTVRETPKRGANDIAILLDDSLSAFHQLPRTNHLLPEPTWLSELRKNFRVRMIAVDQKQRNLVNGAELRFQGVGSRLAAAVQQARSGPQTAGVVLISDGLATDTWPVGKAGKGAPVFPVLLANSVPYVDVSLVSVTASQTAFEDSPVTIQASLSQVGCGGKTVTLEVMTDKGQKLVTQKHTFGANESKRTLSLRVPLSTPGVSFLTVKAVMKEDQRSENNQRLIAIDRGTGPYRVLYVGGRPNWDYKFLRRALSADPEVQVPALLRIAKREPKFEWRGRPGETSNPLFKGFGAKGGEDVQRYDQPVLIRLNTRDAEELKDGFPKSPELLMSEYRAVIIDDVEAEFFSQEQMHLIERFVSERGGSLLMLGGQECFIPGKYDHTPVGRMLPVYLDKLSTAPAVINARLQLTREGWLESWTRLRPEQEAEEARLSTMPAFFSINQTFTIKPGASILATVESEDSRSTPALITQKFGNGRVTALTIGDIWRWGLQSNEHQADMQRFWRQLVRHLIVDVPDRVQFTAQPGEDDTWTLQARVRTATFTPEDEATVSFDVNGSSITAEPSLNEPGLYEAEFHSPKAGTYLAKATVTNPDGKTHAVRQTGWTNNALADETRSFEPDRKWMESVARDTGGRLLMPDELPKLPGMLGALKSPTMERRTTPVWHHPAYLAAVVGLLVGEWLIRRRAGWL
ncbi:MAG: hypothetical protein JNJ83_22875 [Verrucomicrobiaceae bacterium]|nr:hypothetical protein [Verrucomicrobiaceae bacterium]